MNHFITVINNKNTVRPFCPTHLIIGVILYTVVSRIFDEPSVHHINAIDLNKYNDI